MVVCKNPKKIYKQLLASIAASLSFMVIGMVRGYSSPATPSMLNTGGHQLDVDDISLLASLPASGALIAALLSGPCLNYFGRRKTLLLTTVPWTASFLMVAFSAQNKWVLFVGRIVMGMMVGLSAPSAQIYIAECSSPRVRGTLGSLTALFLAGGILLAYIIGAVVEWDTLAWILSIFPVLLLLCMLPMPESPSWLLSMKRDDEARRALQQLRGDHTDITAELERIRNNLFSAPKNSVNLRDVFRPSTVRPLGIALGLMVFQQLSGINVVIFFTVSIFKAAGSTVNDYVATIIIGTVQLISTFPTMFLVDKFGRRLLLLMSGLLMALSSISMGTYFYILQTTDLEVSSTTADLGWLPLASLMVFVVAYSSGYCNVPYLIMSELFPSRYRSIFGSITAWGNQCCIFMILFSFPRFSLIVGNSGAFWFFAVCSLIGIVFVYYLLPETKGKTLEDIEAMFSKKSSDCRENADSSVTCGLTKSDQFEKAADEAADTDSHVTFPL